MARSAVLVTGPLETILLEGNTWHLLSPLPVLPLLGHSSETFSFFSQVKKTKSQTTTFLQQTISNNLPLSQLIGFFIFSFGADHVPESKFDCLLLRFSAHPRLTHSRYLGKQ